MQDGEGERGGARGRGSAGVVAGVVWGGAGDGERGAGSLGAVLRQDGHRALVVQHDAVVVPVHQACVGGRERQGVRGGGG